VTFRLLDGATAPESSRPMNTVSVAALSAFSLTMPALSAAV
jgi:hypothetical protein